MKTLNKPCIPVFSSEKTITILVDKINSERNIPQCAPFKAQRIYIVILFIFSLLL